MEIASGLELAGVIIPLPLEAIYLLTIGVAVRLVAAGIELDEAELDLIIDATLRSVMR
jgi:hypothetical protein